MRSIRVLDCTLRDGGYCNRWEFKSHNIRKIIEALTSAKIDIVECGFLTNTIEYVDGISKFTRIEQANNYIVDICDSDVLFVAMINYGEYDINDLPVRESGMIDGIRVAFHKKDMVSALELCNKIIQKGYLVFMQPMLSLAYSDREFLELIERSNEIKPYAFYIVDSFGSMKFKDVMRFYYLIENNLNSEIQVGFHSHNNLQLAFANALGLLENPTDRNLIIDSSIMGMGRGAGNLNTELLTEHLNKMCGTEYKIRPLLRIIDDVLTGFYAHKSWGYSLPNYISASYNTHPSYAEYLASKCTLTIENMEDIFAMMIDEKRTGYDKDYIENLYQRYMEKGVVNDVHLTEFRNIIAGKTVLIIAPGRSGLEEKEKIVNASLREDVITISINSDYPEAKTNFIFVSNLRRFRELPKSKYKKSIITSNISADGTYLQIGYENLLNDIDMVRDNAGMMLIRFLINMGVKEILLAGMDGYSHDAQQNYAKKDMETVMYIAVMDAMNEGMNRMLKVFSQETTLSFLTSRHYVGNFLAETKI